MCHAFSPATQSYTHTADVEHTCVSTVTIRDELEVLTSACEHAGITSARLCVELIVAETLGCPRLLIHERLSEAFTKEQMREITGRIQRLLSGEPLQYVLGNVNFYGYRIAVDRNVLIPRPETEELLEAILSLSLWNNKQQVDVVDVGTGSGCLAIALALQNERAQILGVDVSKAALSVAHANLLAFGLEQRVKLQCGNLLAGCAPESVDLVISNPPYVSDTDYQRLSPTIRDFEPKVALCGGVEGLDTYRRLIPSAAQVLRPGGWIALEIGANQRQAVESLLKSNGFIGIIGRADMSGHDRIICAKIL